MSKNKFELVALNVSDVGGVRSSHAQFTGPVEDLLEALGLKKEGHVGYVTIMGGRLHIHTVSVSEKPKMDSSELAKVMLEKSKSIGVTVRENLELSALLKEGLAIALNQSVDG